MISDDFYFMGPQACLKLSACLAGGGVEGNFFGPNQDSCTGCGLGSSPLFEPVIPPVSCLSGK